ncbi:MAG: CRISPR-associated endonuclease Cas2 [Patescibacteria group bacterium]|jgi:hypothetical protein
MTKINKQATAQKKETKFNQSIIDKILNDDMQFGSSSRQNILPYILKTVLVVGVVSVAVLAPNAMVLFAKPRKKHAREFTVADMRSAISRLATHGYIRIRKLHGEQLIELTKKGKDKLDAVGISHWRPKMKKTWDKKWRLVIFDIPQTEHKFRNSIRRTLQRVGLLQIQKSVYLYPYDCYELVVMLRRHYHLTDNLTYALVEKIEDDAKYCKHFSLAAR